MSGRHLVTDQDFEGLLRAVRTIAVVGLSPKPDRDSYRVAAYLQQAGYRILPVHPEGGSILGEPVYRCLTDIPASERVDVVDVFRRPDALPDLVPRVLAVGPRALWLQLGVTHAGAEQAAIEGGVDLVVDRCMLVEHQRLVGESRQTPGG